MPWKTGLIALSVVVQLTGESDAVVQDIEVREPTVDVVEFFRTKVSDATPLDTDPYDVVFEAAVGEEVAGMLAIEEFCTPALVRLAVREEYRRCGIATTLLEHALERNDEYYAYVDEENEACQSLLSSFGFKEGGYAPGTNLEHWSLEVEHGD